MAVSVFKSAKDKALSDKIFRITGIRPGRMGVYHEALRHRSVSGKASDAEDARKNGVFTADMLNNERLEFLGDAILDAVIAELLFMRFPYEQEGFLTEMRTRIVNRDQMAFLAMKIGLPQLIDIKPELRQNPTTMKTVGSNALESLIGAIYVDKGFTKARKFILNRLVEQYLNLDKLMSTTVSYKAVFLKWAQKGKHVLNWHTETAGTQRKPLHIVKLVVNETWECVEENGSRKKAEELCCEKAIRHFNIEVN